MRPSRSIPLCLVLGALLTTAIAWSLTLWPSQANTRGTGMPIDIAASPDTGRHMSSLEMRRPAVRGFIVITSAKGPGWQGPAWSAWGKAAPNPDWFLRPDDQPAITEAIAIFPDIRGAPPITPRPPGQIKWPHWLPPIPASDNLIAYGGRACGWPFPTLRSFILIKPGPAPPTRSDALRILPPDRYRAPSYNDHDPAAGTVPLSPIPLPFLLSTLIWAAPLWLLLFAPRTLRTHLRRRRNQCPACGYNLASLPPTSPCPECGRAPA